MKEVTHVRRGQLMLMASTGALLKDCGSINAAKRLSRELQSQGMVVRVAPHKTKAQVIKARAPSRLQRLRAQEAWDRGDLGRDERHVKVSKKAKHKWQTGSGDKRK